jgi:hypothetical protein
MLLDTIVMLLIDNQSSYRWSRKIRRECVTREFSPYMVKRDISARFGLAKISLTLCYHAKERKIPDISCQNICSHHDHIEVNHLPTVNQPHFTLHRPPLLKPNLSSPYPLPHTHSQPSHPVASGPPSQRVRYYRLHDPQWRKKAKLPQPRHAHAHPLVA